MKLKKNIINRKEALKISPDYVAFAEGNFDKWDVVSEAFDTLKRGQTVLTRWDKQFVIAKVTSINNEDLRAIDGPIVRVSNGEYSWRVDGNAYAVPK